MSKVIIMVIIMVIITLLFNGCDAKNSHQEELTSIPLAKIETHINPLLSKANEHYMKYKSSFEEQYNLNVIHYTLFNENYIKLKEYDTTFLGYHLAFVFTDNNTINNPPQLQIHGYRENEQRMQIKIIRCNNNVVDFYDSEIAKQFESENKIIYLIKPYEGSEILAFEYENCIIELYFDQISFSDGALLPLTTKTLMIEDVDNIIINMKESNIFSEPTIRAYVDCLNNY